MPSCSLCLSTEKPFAPVGRNVWATAKPQATADYNKLQLPFLPTFRKTFRWAPVNRSCLFDLAADEEWTPGPTLRRRNLNGSSIASFKHFDSSYSSHIWPVLFGLQRSKRTAPWGDIWQETNKNRPTFKYSIQSMLIWSKWSLNQNLNLIKHKIWTSRGVFHSKKSSYTPKEKSKKILGFFEDLKSVFLIWEWTTPRIQRLNPILFTKSSYTKKNFEKSEKSPKNPRFFLRI